MTPNQNQPTPADQPGNGLPPDFTGLGLGPQSLEAIAQKGFEQPTRIQAEVIPLLVEGQHDVIAQSHTGTGKTAAFGLPLLELITPGQGYIQAIILAPTRELALQVSEELNSLRGKRRFHIVPIYGGQSYELQFRHLKQGVDILVGTPGRIIDHLQRGSIDLSRISHLVLDEADEMLDMGFVDDIEAVLGTCNPEKRMLLFSATMPPRIRQIADTWMRDVREVKVKSQTLTSSLTTQQYMELRDEDRFEALCRIIDHSSEFYGMVFCRTKVQSDRVYTRLLERGYSAEVLHGDVSQAMREKVLDSFRRRLSEILVATDVAARGIDVEGLTHVINFELPQDPESYVHRIGRTGRAGREGTAITFISPREFRKLQFIAKHARGEIKRERLPRVSDIMDQKRGKLLGEITTLLQSSHTGEIEEFDRLAQEILALQVDGKTVDPLQVVTAVLRHQLADWLDSSRYADISDIEPWTDQQRKRNFDGPPGGGGGKPRPWKDHGPHGHGDRNKGPWTPDRKGKPYGNSWQGKPKGKSNASGTGPRQEGTWQPDSGNRHPKGPRKLHN